ncbi:hypothetical protein KOPIIPEJ_00332 [Aeromonas dhakensis]|nr:Uncharacterised protein [Aeromonas hydrophila]
MASAKARFEHPCSRANSGSSRARPDPNWPMARRHSLDIPVSRPGLMASPRRIRGGTNTVPDSSWVGCCSVGRYAALRTVGVPISSRRFSPALWALASDFSLRGQRKVTKRKANPGKSSAARMPSARRSGRPYRRTRHIPVPPAAAPSSLTALLTRSTHLGDLQGGQYRARRRLSGLATRRSERWVSQYLRRLLGELHMTQLTVCFIYLANIARKVIYGDKTSFRGSGTTEISVPIITLIGGVLCHP